MIYKDSVILPTNKLNLLYIKVIHLYHNIRCNSLKVGFFCKIVAKNFFFKLVWRKKLKKGNFLLNSCYRIILIDLSYFYFYYNTGVILKKRLSPLGTFIFGPTFFFLKRKKLHLSFNKLI
jgi:ribosomal protein L14